MNDDTVLRQRAREAIDRGRLPARAPDQLWGGPGTRAECAVCGILTRYEEVELEIEFAEGTAEGTYVVHPRCFTFLESELEKRSRVDGAGAARG